MGHQDRPPLWLGFHIEVTVAYIERQTAPPPPRDHAAAGDAAAGDAAAAEADDDTADIADADT